MQDNKPRKKVGEEIFEQMKQMIVSGQWKLGERIPSEKELMDMFNASRISVREPLKQLASLGLVETRHGSGTFVLGFNENSFIAPMQPLCNQVLTKQDVLRILEVRQIEVIVAGLAAEQSDATGVEELRIIQSGMESSTVDPVVHRATDLEFHLQICRMTNNPYFFQVCRLLYESLEKALTAIVPIMGPQKARYYHARLIDTIAHHYVHEAKATMRDHLAATVEAVRAMPADADVFAPSSSSKA